MKRKVLIATLLFSSIAALGAGFWMCMSYLMRRTYARNLFADQGDGVLYQQAVGALDSLASDMFVPSLILLGLILMTNGVLLTHVLKQDPAIDRSSSQP
jgi:hypothetical protein